MAASPVPLFTETEPSVASPETAAPGFDVTPDAVTPESGPVGPQGKRLIH